MWDHHIWLKSFCRAAQCWWWQWAYTVAGLKNGASCQLNPLDTLEIYRAYPAFLAHRAFPLISMGIVDAGLGSCSVHLWVFKDASSWWLPQIACVFSVFAKPYVACVDRRLHTQILVMRFVNAWLDMQLPGLCTEADLLVQRVHFAWLACCMNHWKCVTNTEYSCS